MKRIDFEISLLRLREKVKSPMKKISRPANIIVSAAVVVFLAACAWLIYSQLNPGIAVPPTTIPPTTAIKIPLISNVSVQEVTETSASITWETDIPSSGTVEYWAQDSAQKYTEAEGEALTLHRIRLEGLEDKTQYCFVVKCSTQSGGESMTQPDFFSTGAAVVSECAEAGCIAPDFTLAEINGNDIGRGDYAGKWMILVFWHTNCSACRSQLAHLQAYYEDMPAGVALVSVNTEEETDVMLLSLLKARGVTYPVLMDRDGALAAKYGVEVWPTAFFIDSESIIRKIVHGRFNNAEELAAALASAEANE